MEKRYRNFLEKRDGEKRYGKEIWKRDMEKRLGWEERRGGGKERQEGEGAIEEERCVMRLMLD